MKPTHVRYALLTVATINAFLLYLDRICMTAVVQSASFEKEMALDPQRVGDIVASFFFAYALGQMPAGYLADRFGPRRMLVFYIGLWSLCTALTGFVSGVMGLVIVRCACGLAEAGAYPSCALLISRWFPFQQRARANGTVAFGGRVGNSVALWVTAVSIAALGSWRPVLWIYGSIGIALAIASFVIFRDTPQEHPWTNEAERQLAPQLKITPFRFPWRALLQHSGLWFFSLGNMGLNFGWAFLITWLPAYLRDVYNLDPVVASRYVSIALVCGLGGMLFGGWWCDLLTRRFGQRWGRRLPFVIGATVCILAYLLCPLLTTPLAVGVVCSIVAFASDSVGPAVWAISQDVGGRYVASTLAWSNMWGNFGASLVAKLIPFVLTTRLHYGDWREIFWLCAGAFLLLGVAPLFIDTTRPLATQ